jgi:hypothetical protein
MRAAALALAIACAPLLALADDAGAPTEAAPLPASVNEAKRHFKQGIVLYNNGDYNGALAEFEASYRGQPAPAILYNIALTEMSIFRYVESIEHFTEYLSEEKTTTPERRREVERFVTDMKALMADLRLSIAPDGAAVMVDGRALGTAPLKPFAVAAGTRVIEVSADGYRPLRKEVVVAAGAPLRLNIQLEPLPRIGRVRIVTAPRGARIRVDGAPAPGELTVGQGGHTIEVSADGYRPHRSELLIAAGQSRTVEVTLDPLPPPPRPIYTRWWFWTVGAAVIVGIGAAIAIPLSLQRQEPLPGTLGTSKVN